MTLSYATYCAAIQRETDAFVRVTTGADLTTPVPACPGWTLVDLIRHTGGLQRWFTGLLRELTPQRFPPRDADSELPVDPAQYPAWVADGAAAAGAVLRATDPDAPMWAWAADRHARFWARRMLFETLVHRVDAEHALGLSSAIDPVLAADGVDEFLANLPYAEQFTPRVAELRGADEVIRFECADLDRRWAVRLRRDGFGLDPDATTAHATVRAAAADLLLFVYGRPAPGAVDLLGDEALLQRWRTNSRF
jgi:uncharacterized protein (TIGR03083 family)